MTGIAAVHEHQKQALQPMDSASRVAAQASSGTQGSQDTSASTISSNDFLTLLVSELKNQDPTAESDPNQYVNQLVQVNSLQQLIQINQTLTSDLGSGSSSTQSGSVDALGGKFTSSAQAIAHGAKVAATGNLSTPPFNVAAQRVAQSLGMRH